MFDQKNKQTCEMFLKNNFKVLKGDAALWVSFLSIGCSFKLIKKLKV
tara:strand:- start:222 stop:362 length:141 start_codon:yes stop_codon:yes gene_type:complete